MMPPHIRLSYRDAKVFIRSLTDSRNHYQRAIERIYLVTGGNRQISLHEVERLLQETR